MIKRELESTIKPLLGSKKAIVVMGARQVGKSTLLTSMLEGRNDVMWLNALQILGLGRPINFLVILKS